MFPLQGSIYFLLPIYLFPMSHNALLFLPFIATILFNGVAKMLSLSLNKVIWKISFCCLHTCFYRLIIVLLTLTELVLTLVWAHFACFDLILLSQFEGFLCLVPNVCIACVLFDISPAIFVACLVGIMLLKVFILLWITNVSTKSD